MQLVLHAPFQLAWRAVQAGRTVTAGSLLLHCLELMELAAQFGTLGLSSQVVALPSAAPAAAHKQALEVDLEIDKKVATRTGHTSAAL